jgi:hypothetical protein
LKLFVPFVPRWRGIFEEICAEREQAGEQPVNKLSASDFFCVQAQAGTVLEFHGRRRRLGLPVARFGRF